MVGRTTRLASPASAAILVGAVVLAPAPAAADETHDAVPGDVVKVKDGSFYRGTILELVTGDHVDLRLPSGDVKRFVMAEVIYAGAAGADAPAPVRRERSAARPLASETGAALVHFESATPDVDFHIRADDATVGQADARGYEHICAAPCEASLPTGRHRLALSRGAGRPIEAEKAVTIRGPSKLVGTYEDHHEGRVTGWITLGLSLAAGMTMVVVGLVQTSQDCDNQSVTGACVAKPSPNGGLMVAGGVVMGLGLFVGLGLGLHRDGVTIEVVPLDAALRLSSPLRRESAWLAPSGGAVPGLGARLSWF